MQGAAAQVRAQVLSVIGSLMGTNALECWRWVLSFRWGYGRHGVLELVQVAELVLVHVLDELDLVQDQVQPPGGLSRAPRFSRPAQATGPHTGVRHGCVGVMELSRCTNSTRVRGRVCPLGQLPWTPHFSCPVTGASNTRMLLGSIGPHSYGASCYMPNTARQMPAGGKLCLPALLRHAHGQNFSGVACTVLRAAVLLLMLPCCVVLCC